MQTVIDSSTSPRVRVVLDKAQQGALDQVALAQADDEPSDAVSTVAQLSQRTK